MEAGYRYPMTFPKPDGSFLYQVVMRSENTGNITAILQADFKSENISILSGSVAATLDIIDGKMGLPKITPSFQRGWNLSAKLKTVASEFFILTEGDALDRFVQRKMDNARLLSRLNPVTRVEDELPSRPRAHSTPAPQQ